MGIHGLTGFIDNNQHLLHEHQLHDCSVVLDGNNFYHFLYYACHVQCSFGGDYDIFRKKLITTFSSFKMCGITPYVIMDGAYTVDGRKLKTSLSRASARIRLVDVMANHQRGQTLPTLAYETFIQTLDELGVHHATCQFEADNEIAVLSNKLKCPVISNDSDFYIFDLSHGFLPMDYLDFRPLEKRTSDGTQSYHYLYCRKYHVDDFINSFDGLSRSVLPVFASLLGNDFINARAFSTFYSRVKVPKVVSKRFSLPPKLSKVISVLHWLHTQNDSTEFQDIKNELLKFIKPRRQYVVEKLFMSSVNGYVDVENFQGFNLYQFVTVGPEKCPLLSAVDFCSYGGKTFPDWFTKAVCCGQITPSILNCLILHRVIILTQVEDLSMPSSFICSLGLRRIIYGILLQEDCLKNNEDTDTLSSEVPYALSSEVPDAFSSEVPDALFSEVPAAMSSEVPAALSSEVPDALSSEVPDALFSEVPAALSSEVPDTLFSEVPAALSSEVPAALSSENPAALSSEHLADGSGLNSEETCFEENNCNETSLHLNVERLEEEENDVKVSSNTCEGERDDDFVGEDGSEVEVIENVTQTEGLKTEARQKRGKQFCVEEYTRLNKNLLKGYVEPVYRIGTVSVPSLASLTNLSLEDRKLVLTESLGVDQTFINKFSNDLQLFAACLVVWSRNASPKITRLHLETVIAGVMMLRVAVSLADRKGGIGAGDKRIGEVKEKGDGDQRRGKDKLENVDGDQRRGKNKLENVDGDQRREESDCKQTKNNNNVSELVQERNQLKDKCTSDLINKLCETEKNGVQENSDTSNPSILSMRESPRISEKAANVEDTTEAMAKSDSSNIEINIHTLCSESNLRDLENVHQNLNKYHTKYPTFNNKNHYIPSITHMFAQLQACMVDAINLNKLLRFPLPNLCPADLINGTFLYNFYVDVSARAKSDLFLAAMFGRNSNIFSTFELFRDSIIEYVGGDCFMSPSSLIKKTRKRKSKCKDKDNTGDVNRAENDEVKEISVKTIPGFHVRNMFSALSMED